MSGVLAVLFVLVVLGVAVGGLWYAYYDAQRTKRQEAAARNQVVQEQRHAFRRGLLHALQASPSEFHFDEFVASSGIAERDAREVAEDTYVGVYARALQDGVISPAETIVLDRLAHSVNLSSQRRAAIESNAKQGAYRQFLEKALSDGSLTEGELKRLEQLRAGLRLARQDVAAAAHETAWQTYLIHFREIIGRGEIGQGDAQSLASLREATGLSEADAYQIVRRDAVNVYRARFYELKQDGDLNSEEEAELDTLQRFLGIPDIEVQSFKREIERVRLLASIRNGALPRTSTRKLLEGGEVCHWEAHCTHLYETRSKQGRADGEIIVSSERIIFTSPTKSFEFRPSKIVNVEEHGNGVALKTSSRGNGWYLVEEPDMLAAYLEGVVRRHKYLAVEQFSSTMARHIPDGVKRDVWARNQGQCVKCAAVDYLEFDHIIPYTKGGAPTVNNVQLLCRRCNGIKRDRI